MRSSPSLSVNTRLAVIVVSRDSSSPLGTLLPRLLDGQTAVVVVDNHSHDDSVEVATRAGAQIVRMSTNAGYAVACNEGVRALGAGADWIGFVNPDVLLSADDMRRLTADVPEEIWAVAPLTLTSDGAPQADVARPAPTPWFVAAMYLGLTRSRAPVSSLIKKATTRYHYTETLSGGCLFVRRARLALVGGWDEAYFFNIEDIDLCVRIGKAGGRLAVDRGIRVTHNKAHSSANSDDEARRLECARAYATYFQIQGSRWETALVAACVYVGCLARRFAERLVRPSRASSSVKSRYGRLRRLLWTSVRQAFRHEPPNRPAHAEFLDP